MGQELKIIEVQRQPQADQSNHTRIRMRDLQPHPGAKRISDQCQRQFRILALEPANRRRRIFLFSDSLVKLARAPACAFPAPRTSRSTAATR